MPENRKFQPTLPHRERPVQIHHPGGDQADFNPRSRTGSDYSRWSATSQVEISTHAPAQGATLGWATLPWPVIFQPTLPHRERPFSRRKDARESVISTHAPAQGATYANQRNGRPKRISTHAPAQGATLFSVWWTRLAEISTHAPAQGATAEKKKVQAELHISTHAPAQGATCRKNGVGITFSNFNPRSRTGSDRT